MAGKSAGFAISIGINDAASAGLDKINKHIAALNAPAERFNKSLTKFGEVTGINRAAEGMHTLGDRALGAARAVERLAGPMASITSIGSLGGLMALTKGWADAGSQISRTANLLNVPVDKLSQLELANRLAGGSADSLDSSMKGLQDTLAEAKNKGGPVATLLNNFKIGFEGVGGAAEKASDRIDQVAHIAASFKDPHAGQHFLEMLHMDPGLLPFFQQYDKFMTEAEDTNAKWTKDMADHAAAVEHSWTHLAEVTEGVMHRVADSWSGTTIKVLDNIADWVKGFDNLSAAETRRMTAITAAVGALGALRIAPWILRALGWLLPGELSVPLAVAGGTYEGFKGAVQTATDDSRAQEVGLIPDGYDDFGHPIGYHDASGRSYTIEDAARIAAHRSFSGEGDYTAQPSAPSGNAWGGPLGGGTAPNGVPRTGALFGPQRLVGPRRMGTIPPDVERQIRLQARLQGLDEEHMVRLARAEAGGYDRVSPAGAIGPMQLMPDTARDLVVDPWDWRQNVAGGLRYYRQNLDRFGGNYAAADAAYNAGPNRASVGRFAATGDASGLPGETQQYVASVNGRVQVDVNVRGVPPGSTASAVAAGAAWASPPRIEHSMPMVGGVPWSNR